MKYMGGSRKVLVAAVVVLAAGSVWAGSLTDGLTFYASLDKGIEADQAAGSPEPRMNQQTSVAEGRFGQGVELKGDARLYYSGVDNFDLREGTVAFWAKRYEPWAQRKSCILFKAVAGPDWNRNGIYFMVTDWNQLRVWVWDEEAKQTLWMTRPLPEATNEWYHLAFTYRDGEVRLFVNGEEGSYVPDGRGDPMSVMPSGRVTNLQFGSDYNHSFQGVYDEMRVYNRVLTPEEIMALYQHVPGDG
jgi:hypothetical protein